MNIKSAMMLSIITMSSLMAQDISLGISGSTLGVGLEAATNISNSVNVRGIISGFNYSKSLEESNVQYDGKLSLMGAGLLLDYYPFESGIRLSAGGFYNGTKASITGTPNAGSTYDINGVTYTAAQVGTLTGAIEYKKLMPYLGLGFANPMKGSAFTFGFDAGAMFGTAKADLTASNATLGSVLANDIAAEKRQLEDAVSSLKIYPFLNLSLSYRF